jgi:murein DD-endopeptidase MepM/ murein hydrolase activator NlpD
LIYSRNIRYFLFCLMMLLLVSCDRGDENEYSKIGLDLEAIGSEQIFTDSTAGEQMGMPVTFLMSGEIPKGGVLANVLRENNLNRGEVYEAVSALNEVFDLRRVQPGDKFSVMTDSMGTIYELTFYRNPLKKYMVYRDSTGIMRAIIEEEKLNLEVMVLEGMIESSLYRTVLDASEEPALAMMFTQIFQWDIDFFIDPRQGDRIRILYEKYSLNGDHVRYGNILAAAYASKSGESVAYRYTDSKGSSRYFTEKGISFQKAFLKSPLNFTRITSKFGRRIHPITKKASMHNGVDYAAPYGTPVEAAADGVIEKARWNPGHTGNTVIIRHPNGYKTLYGHLSKYGKYKEGQRVQQHDVIGYVGSTGRSTGNHLHYTIYHHDKPIDPLKLKNVAGPPVSESEMTIFSQQVENLKAQLFVPVQTEEAIDYETSEVLDTLLTDEMDYAEEEMKEASECGTYIIIIIMEFVIILLLVVLLIKKVKIRAHSV